ncbi:hypothetical protein BCL57_002946 [Agromyces flavus]|uniref:Uncharacterized protein n=2 Tax=Agromyces flavus TaxID=589382 RepID=A0ABT1KPF8_9MICO|nr:hypothetical protein [Agromyces flavus]MCP2368770.1 hypothetical protein [Agromyces flavus]GGI47992.1 hypothetical protein GCM10010932_26800 [Agromyces flavus]
MTMSDPQSDDPTTDREMDAALEEAERKARAEEDADPEERVAVRDDDTGGITEERAQ